MQKKSTYYYCLIAIISIMFTSNIQIYADDVDSYQTQTESTNQNKTDIIITVSEDSIIIPKDPEEPNTTNSNIKEEIPEKVQTGIDEPISKKNNISFFLLITAILSLICTIYIYISNKKDFGTKKIIP